MEIGGYGWLIEGDWIVGECMQLLNLILASETTLMTVPVSNTDIRLNIE